MNIGEVLFDFQSEQVKQIEKRLIDKLNDFVIRNNNNFMWFMLITDTELSHYQVA